VSWTAPSSNGGSSITGYSVQYSTDGGSTWTTSSCSGTSTSCTVTGLTNGTSYIFQVAATNSVGTGSYSSSSASVTPHPATTVAGAPTNVTVTNGNVSATISWTAPSSDGGSTILSYAVTASPGGATCTTSATTCSISGLTAGVAYNYYVIATNAVGNSAHSSSVTATAELQVNVASFRFNAASLTVSLKAQIMTFVTSVKSQHLKSISILGYANFNAPASLSTQRAKAVKAYVLAKLASMKLTGVSVTVAGGTNTGQFNNGHSGAANRCIVMTAS
jgi:outer membrane protein OmpA-like peptidoglycan-associated protein